MEASNSYSSNSQDVNLEEVNYHESNGDASLKSTESLLRMNSAELLRVSQDRYSDRTGSQPVQPRLSVSSSSNDGFAVGDVREKLHRGATTDGMLERGSTKRFMGSQAKNATEEDQMKAVFVDAAAMKEKVRQNLCKPTHKVTDFYKEHGVWQAIAKHFLFENITLGVIAFNALWISIDTDLNGSDVLWTAHPVFQAAENFFCAFFFMEWFIRFMAFKQKRDGLRDRWFTFDSGMVLLMVLETWVMTLFAAVAGGMSSGGLGNASVLRVARLLRLSRMARMARLLRAMPELMILIKGMVAAMRSVFFTLFLLVIIMYVFAVAFKQLTDGTKVGEQHFGTVMESMYTLLLYGTLLDDVGILSARLGKESIVLSLIFFLFILLGALTVMNMLIGVLCEVVSAVAATEREEMLVGYVNRKVRKIVEELDQDGGGTISKDEFVRILENMEAVKALQDVGVDVVGLVDFADVIFEEEEDLSFPKFMEVVLQLRGSNNATVKDVVDLRKLVRTETMRTNLLLERLQNLISSQQGDIKSAIRATQKANASNDRASFGQTRKEDEVRSSHKSLADLPSDTGNTHVEAGNLDASPRKQMQNMSGMSRSSAALEGAVELDLSPWPANSSSYVELLRQSTDEDSFGSEKVEGIPLESDNANTHLLEAHASDSSHILKEFRGLWKPCDLTAVRLQAARQGDLEKILETPAYWKALKCIPEPLHLTTALHPIGARLQAAHTALDFAQAGGPPPQLGESAKQRIQACTPAENLGPVVPSDANKTIHLPTLHEQISKLSKVMVVGLSEVMKIQDDLSHNGLSNSRKDGQGVSSAS